MFDSSRPTMCECGIASALGLGFVFPVFLFTLLLGMMRGGRGRKKPFLVCVCAWAPQKHVVCLITPEPPFAPARTGHETNCPAAPEAASRPSREAVDLRGAAGSGLSQELSSVEDTHHPKRQGLRRTRCHSGKNIEDGSDRCPCSPKAPSPS